MSHVFSFLFNLSVKTITLVNGAFVFVCPSEWQLICLSEPTHAILLMLDLYDLI